MGMMKELNSVEQMGQGISGLDLIKGTDTSTVPGGILKNMYEKLSSGKLCDVLFEVQGKEFFTHKAIVAEASPVFEAMFTNGMRESRFSRSTTQKISLPEDEKDLFEILLRFLYLGELLMSDDTALRMLKIADKYQIEKLKDALDHLLSDFSYEDPDCSKLWSHACKYELKALRGALVDFVQDKLQQKHSAPVFSSAPADLIRDALESVVTSSKESDIVLENVIGWTLADQDHRSSQCDKVLQMLGKGRVSRQCLVNLSAELLKLSPHSSEAREMLQKCVEQCDHFIKNVLAEHKFTSEALRCEGRDCTVIASTLKKIKCAHNGEWKFTSWVNIVGTDLRARVEVLFNEVSEEGEGTVSYYLGVERQTDDAVFPPVALEWRISFITSHGMPWGATKDAVEVTRADGWGKEDWVSRDDLMNPHNDVYDTATDSVQIRAMLFVVSVDKWEGSRNVCR